MKALIARRYVEWLTGRAQRVFFVYGMRRSGNHACIGWMVNALEGKAVTLGESTSLTNFNYSNSGRCFFINDVSTIDSRIYLQRLRQHFREIRRAQFIIISAEDESAGYADNWRIPRRSKAIFVRRGTLNLMASRFHNINRRAREGLGASMQSMKAEFFATLKANINAPRGAVWDFERWQGDAAWRAAFLANLGLECDIPPSMVGLGSSFSPDRKPTLGDTFDDRFRLVEPQDAWTSFIRNAASRFPEVFSPEEHRAIRSLMQG